MTVPKDEAGQEEPRPEEAWAEEEALSTLKELNDLAASYKRRAHWWGLADRIAYLLARVSSLATAVLIAIETQRAGSGVGYLALASATLAAIVGIVQSVFHLNENAARHAAGYLDLRELYMRKWAERRHIYADPDDAARIALFLDFTEKTTKEMESIIVAQGRIVVEQHRRLGADPALPKLPDLPGLLGP